MRRSGDGELCGRVERRREGCCALTVFGAVIGVHERREDAVQHVLTDGLAALADRWTLRHRGSGGEEVVCIQEADAARVTVARGCYSLPGVPTLSITAEQLAAGEWELRR